MVGSKQSIRIIYLFTFTCCLFCWKPWAYIRNNAECLTAQSEGRLCFCEQQPRDDNVKADVKGKQCPSLRWGGNVISFSDACRPQEISLVKWVSVRCGFSPLGHGDPVPAAARHFGCRSYKRRILKEKKQKEKAENRAWCHWVHCICRSPASCFVAEPTEPWC